MDIDKWLTFNVHLYAIQITLQHMLKKIATCVDATLHERFLFEFNIQCIRKKMQPKFWAFQHLG